MAGATERQITIRRYQPSDREALLDLAVRLTEGIAPWRDRDAFHAAARGWVEGAIERDESDGTLLVAVDEQGSPRGFVGVNRGRHFTGDEQATIGELVVDKTVEGQGVGRRLATAAECWATEHDLRIVTLLTGAANRPARAFYRRLGFQEEEVRLTKLIE